MANAPMADKPLNVIIVGGSLTGLFHGIVLKRLGHNVRILERASPDTLREQGAGITARDEVQKFFSEHDRFPDQPFFVRTEPRVQFMNRNAEVEKVWKMQLFMTSWDTLFYRLRANFDGLESDYVSMSQCEPDSGVGTASYQYGCNVTGVNYSDGLVTLEYERSTGGAGIMMADLVIAADGPGSSIRKMLCPGTERQYVGYVAWRGTVVESQISVETKNLFRTCLNYFMYKNGHILVYLIPGKNGSLKPGDRLLNYVWYCNYPADSPDLTDLMTDKEGHKHRITMPMGKLRPEISSAQTALAKAILPAAFAEIVQKTAQPFVQVITEVSAPKAVHFEGHFLLLGDALCTFRPHVGSSTNQAAMHALLVEKLLTGGLTLRAFEREIRNYAKLTSLTSKAWGNKNQFSVRTFVVSVFWLVLAYVECWVRRGWEGVR